MTTNFGADLKVLVIGNAFTGKTSFVRRWIGGQFSNSYKATIAPEFQYKIININNTIFRIHLWDLAGQDKNVFITKTFGKDCFGALILCEAKNEESLQSTVNWKKALDDEITFCDGSKVPVFLIENKIDLYEKEDENQERFAQFGKDNEFDSWYKVSAKTGKNINETMNDILVHIITKLNSCEKVEEPNEEKVERKMLNNVASTVDQDEKKKCC